MNWCVAGAFWGVTTLMFHRYWGSQDLNFGNLGRGVLVAGLGKLHSTDRRRTGGVGGVEPSCMCGDF